MLELDVLLVPFTREVYASLPSEEQVIYQRLLSREDPGAFSMVYAPRVARGPRIGVYGKKRYWTVFSPLEISLQASRRIKQVLIALGAVLITLLTALPVISPSLHGALVLLALLQLIYWWRTHATPQTNASPRQLLVEGEPPRLRVLQTQWRRLHSTRSTGLVAFRRLGHSQRASR